VFLTAITWLVFGQTVHHGFVNYDDGANVYDNSVVKSGLTLKSILWAFQFSQSDYWHPLTMMSHMLDCQLYGLAPAGHHLTNVLLHATVAILLFLVLRQMTGAFWRSAFAAAVFAIHPLRVESVAWVSERKDMLHGIFCLLTIGAYVRYVRHPWSLARYGAVVLLFTFGLMSKPTLMTLPFGLLLLDYWPLRRFVPLASPGDVSGSKSTGWRSYRPVFIQMIVEKLPLFMLSAASCVQAAIGNNSAFMSNKDEPIILQISNPMVSYVAYIGQMVCPVKLAVLYPFPVEGLPLGAVMGAVFLLVSISTVLFILRQRHPCYLVCWLWYLGMLVPMIGFVQAGSIARADRYTYLPQIGLYVLLTWAVADLCAGWRHRRVVLGGGSTIILLALIFCARAQTACWRNSELLWTHTLACTSNNFIAHNNLGNELLQQGRINEAIGHFQTALQIRPDYAEAHFSFGLALLQQGRMDEALSHFQTALQIQPGYVEAHNNLGNILLQKGDVDEAMVHYQKALQIQPDSVESHANLGNALLQKGRAREAIAQFQKALQIKPDYMEVLNNLAWVLATSPQASLRNGNQAVALAQRANQLTGDGNPVILGTLAAACAEAGRFPEAVATAQRALQLAGAQSNPALANIIRSQIKLYQAGVPFHQPEAAPQQ
jgi:Flp pilus assembly protein TadD